MRRASGMSVRPEPGRTGIWQQGGVREVQVLKLNQQAKRTKTAATVFTVGEAVHLTANR